MSRESRSGSALFWTVFRIQDVYPGSRIQCFPSRICIKEFKYFNPKNGFLSSRKYDPGCSSRIRIFYPSKIPDPGVKKAPDPGSTTLILGAVPHLSEKLDPDPHWSKKFRSRRGSKWSHGAQWTFTMEAWRLKMKPWKVFPIRIILWGAGSGSGSALKRKVELRYASKWTEVSVSAFKWCGSVTLATTQKFS